MLARGVPADRPFYWVRPSTANGAGRNGQLMVCNSVRNLTDPEPALQVRCLDMCHPVALPRHLWNLPGIAPPDQADDANRHNSGLRSPAAKAGVRWQHRHRNNWGDHKLLV